MEPAIITLLVIALIPLLWFIGNYNGLVRLRNHCRESWSGIDTELKRRHDLIPNLVKTVQAYAKHETSVFAAVTEARAVASRPHQSPRDQARDENRLVVSLGGLFAVAEDYPELKSDRNFLHLQQELVNTEDRIQAARRFHNANVRDLGNRIEMFPSSIVASMFGFERWDFFEIDNLSERIAPKVEMG
jgi:LemA protein